MAPKLIPQPQCCDLAWRGCVTWGTCWHFLVIIAIPSARFRMSVAEEQSSEHAATLKIDAGTSTRLGRRELPKEPKQG
jgi:hypothetical protein